jgi:hypothetical protein
MLRFSSIAIALIFALIGVSACGGGSPTSPSSPSSSIETRTTFLGQTVDAISGVASANVTVLVPGAAATTSDAEGKFQLDATGSAIRARMQGAGMIDREAIMRPSTGERTRLSLIPTTFDLAAFDEMFRGSHARLQRWTTRPALVIVASVMDYQGEADAYTAANDRLTDDDVAQMIADLTEGLSLLTGGTYTSFASVEIERPSAGTRVSVLRQGKVVVGRYNGIATDAGRVGYGRWFEFSDGSIAGGAVFLDPRFDKSDPRRRLLRMHELGHALGYNHVTKRPSIMNAMIGTEPTDFDRAAAMIAFQRPIGNQSPDTDPDGTRAASVGGAAGWSAPSDCGQGR